jgi:hypothetical protein
LIVCFLALALAQDAPEVEPRAVEEVVVWGRHHVRDHRERVVRAMRAQGWPVARRRADHVSFRPPESWMGRARLHSDGTMTFTRPVLAFDAPRNPHHEYDAEQVHDGRSQPALQANAAWYLLPSRTRLDPIQRNLVAELDSELSAYSDVVHETSFHETRDVLPERLDQLWGEGDSLDGGARLETPASRRLAVLAYWATRAPTPEGYGVCRVVEIWLRETVQVSEYPVTAEEQVSAEMQRTDGRKLHL